MKKIWSSMQTASGKRFDFDDLESNEYDIHDIATHLSKICRFNGAVKGDPYSVAQHCCIASVYAPEPLQLTMLMHDAAEAYIGDIMRPLKRRLGGAFLDFEKALEEVIARRFGLLYPFPNTVGLIDLGMLATEKRDLLMPSNHEWKSIEGITPFAIKITPWEWIAARDEFLNLYTKYQQFRINIGHGG